jgi:tetratricopeptide (TPR) repeat protein
MPRPSAFLLALFLGLLFSMRVVAAPPDLSLQAGEIRFDGTVSAVNLEASTLVVSVSSFTLPSGKTSTLAAPKPKTILLGEAKIFDSGVAEHELSKGDLKPGLKVVVIGKDAGSGKDVPARIVAMMPAPATGIPPQVAAPDEEKSSDKNQVVLQSGETRYDGKITGVLSATIFAISVVSTTNARGETTELAEPQTRNIQIGADTTMRSRDDLARKMQFTDLKIGLRVTLAGKDAGAKTIKAREVAVWDDEESKSRSLGTVEIHHAVAVLLNRGDEFQRARAYEDAAKTYNAALQAAMNENDAPGQGMVYNRLGLTYEDLGQSKRALESFQQALEIWRRVGNSNSEATTLLNLGGYYIAHDDLKAAREAVANAIRLYGGSSNNRALAIAYNQLGEIQAGQGEGENAVASWQQALSLARQTQDHDEEIMILSRLAVGYARLKQAEKSNEIIEQLVAALPQIADKNEAGRTNFMIGLAYKYSGQNDKAKTFFTQAQTLWTEAGRRDNAEAAQKQIEKLGTGDTDEAAPRIGAIVPAANA